MSRDAGFVRFVRTIARLVSRAYPCALRREFGAAFEDIAQDRFCRERTAGRGPIGATAATVRLLVTDLFAARRLVRARVVDDYARRPRAIARFDPVDRLGADVRNACRHLVRFPLLTLVATASLAVGIGATSAIFTIAQALLFAPAPGIADPSRLVDIGRAGGDSGFDTVSYPTYTAVRNGTTTMTGVYALRMEPRPLSLDTPGGAELAYGLQVSATYFDVLGVQPERGRFFHAADDRPGTPLPVVVLSHAFWTRRFAADPATVGRSIVLGGDRVTVLGVAPAGFQGTNVLAPDVWLPLTAGIRATASDDLIRSRDSLWLMLGGRMKPGVTIDRVRAETAAISRSLAAGFPETAATRRLRVEPTSRSPIGGAVVSSFLALLMGLVGLVLAGACANLCGLLLARASLVGASALPDCARRADG